MLTSTSFRQVKAKVVAELQQRLRARAEAELKRLVGFRLRLDVPLRQQIRDFLEGELSSMLSRLSISAGPAGIIVSLVGARLVSLVGAALQQALRQKGHAAERTARTVAGFEARQAELRRLPADATLDRVRSVARSAERALAATSFLEGDLRRAGRTDLLARLQAAGSKLRTTLNVQRMRFLLDSDLVGEDFRVAISYANGVRADAERLAKQAGCAAGGGSQAPANGAKPTAAACPPGFTMEALQSLPPYGVAGTFPVTPAGLVQVSAFDSKCSYVNAAGAEAFVILIDYVPPDAPGRIASGNCGGRLVNPGLPASTKRYLTVGGGERITSTRAQGGNDAVLRKALALAEAQGVGRACP